MSEKKKNCRSSFYTWNTICKKKFWNFWVKSTFACILEMLETANLFFMWVVPWGLWQFVLQLALNESWYILLIIPNSVSYQAFEILLILKMIYVNVVLFFYLSCNEWDWTTDNICKYGFFLCFLIFVHFPILLESSCYFAGDIFMVERGSLYFSV